LINEIDLMIDNHDSLPPINLLSTTIHYIGWLHSLSKKIYFVCFKPALKAVGAFFLDQILLFISFILPLKILLLAGSEGIPHYLTGLISPEDKKIFILLLAFGAVATFILHLAMEKVFQSAVIKGAFLLTQKANKFTLFNNQSDQAKQYFLKLCASAGSVLLALTFFSLGMALNFMLFTASAVLLIIEFLLLHQIGKKWHQATSYLQSQTGLNTTLKRISAFNFLFGFAFLLIQLLGGSQQNLLLSVVSMLLLRQITSRVEAIISDGVKLWNDRIKINILYFSSSRHQLASNATTKRIISSLTPEARALWFPIVIGDALGTDVKHVESYWIDPPTIDVSTFHVRCADNDDSSITDYFIKIYGKGKLQAAIHEQTLFESIHPLPCAPTYLGESQIKNGKILVFKGLSGNTPTYPQMAKETPRLQNCLLGLTLKSDFVDKSQRTRPAFFHLLNEEFIKPLFIAAVTNKDVALVENFLAMIPKYRLELSQLPLAIINPDLNFRNAHLTDDGKIIITHWARWHIEPAGSSLQTGRFNLNTVTALLEDLATQRTEYHSVTPQQFMRCAWVYSVFDLVRTQCYGLVLDRLQQLENLEQRGFND
jgi:hypothetical protein